jgi:NTE family protein
LDWRYDLCIIEFVKGIQKHFINQNILDHHKIDTTILSKTNKEIEDYISTQIGFNMIIQNGLSISEVATISNISTNLTALTASQIDLLSRHASVLTDLQIKLYCPSL